MKKWIKYSIALVLVTAAALMLCSCKALDQLKWDHAVYAEKGKKNTIQFRGKTYELFDANTLRGKKGNDYSLVLDGSEMGRVTEPDVPVLLSVTEGEPILFGEAINDAPLFFTVHYNGYSDDVKTRFYCIKEQASDFENMIKEAKMDHFYLIKYEWSEEDDDSIPKKQVFSDAASEAILRTINRPFNKKTDYTNWDQIEDLSVKYLQPQFCDKNMLFTDNQSVQIVRTKGNDHTYYIGVTTNQDPTDSWYDACGAFQKAEWRRVSDTDKKAIEPLFTEYDEVQEFYFEESEEE